MGGAETNNRVLVLLVFILCFVLVGLVIGNVFVFINSGEHNYTITCDNVDSGELSKCLRNGFEERFERNDLTSAISIYQKFIDNSSDDDEKGRIIIWRLNSLVSSCSMSCKDEILKDINVLSELPEDINRMSVMCAHEKKYGDEEKAEQYCDRVDSLKKEKSHGVITE